MGILGNIDAFLLDDLIYVRAQLEVAKDDVRKRGSLIVGTDRNGKTRNADGSVILVENPSVKLQKEYQTQFGNILKMLNISPEARNRLSKHMADMKIHLEDDLTKALEVD